MIPVSAKKNHLPIKSWSEDDQPREKLRSRGKKTLSNAELLAILVRTGSRGESALSLCQRILNDYKNDLHELGALSVAELMKYKGMGEAKAITVVSALELGRRRQAAENKSKAQILSSNDAFHFIAHRLQDIPFEEFWVILLNRAMKVIREVRISSGGVNATVVDPRIIMKYAIESLANAIILIHNHPSGTLKPSNNDLSLTKKLESGGKFLDIKVADHLIITDTGYFSFADEGLIG